MDMKLAYSNSNVINREVADGALKNTTKRDKPFVVEWRQCDAKASSWQSDSEAGCGCGPVE